MDLLQHLDRGHSKRLTLELVEYIGNSQERFDDFMPYFLHEEWRICQRAAWSLGIICEAEPYLMLKWLPDILKAMNDPKHDAVVRNALRALAVLDEFPEDLEGDIYDKCFNYIIDPKYPIAFKAFAMSICRKIAVKYPELKEELIEVIFEAMEHGSAGVKSRGKKEISILKKS